MDFPDFGNNDDNQNNFNQENENKENNDIVINEDFNQGDIQGNFDHQSHNVVIGEGTSNNFMAMDWGAQTDPEETKRMEERKAEEDERRRKLNEKIEKELEDKQNRRKEAMEYLQRWEDQRANNISKKKEFNKTNESEYLKQREEEKAGHINPWDKVIQNIQLKEGEHKGLRDITRMKAVILQRKNDFVNMKMK